MTKPASKTAKLSRAMKYVVLLASALGVLAFFLPFFVFDVGTRKVEASAHTLLVGFDDPALEPLRYEQNPDCVENVLQLDDGHVMGGYVCGQANKHLSYVPIYFASAIVFVLLALWAIVRRRMSGLAGVLALPASFLAIGGWMRELKLDRVTETSHTSIGASLLGISGVIALAATVVILIWREPHPPRKKAVVKSTLPEARVVR